MDPNLFSGDNSSSSAAAFDPMFSGVSLQSLLFADMYPPLASLTDEQPNLNAENNSNLLLVPKPEHNNNRHHLSIEPPPQPFNFFPYDYDNSSFQRLPELHSPEQKRLRRVDDKKTMIPQSKLARERRQKLSEKTRCLQKLMPWDKKMDQATLLEEACKYVKFLQAQSSVLQSMPSQSHSGSGYSNGLFGDLERLNRNQVLQVLVNSPVAQTRLYSQGFCVFSMEQVALLRKLYDRRVQIADHAASASSSKSFFN